jgi:hypothetical protein
MLVVSSGDENDATEKHKESDGARHQRQPRAQAHNHHSSSFYFLHL